MAYCSLRNYDNEKDVIVLPETYSYPYAKAACAKAAERVLHSGLRARFYPKQHFITFRNPLCNLERLIEGYVYMSGRGETLSLYAGTFNSL